MSTSLNTSIKPQFRTIDGLRIRYADCGGSQEPAVLLTSPWTESVYAFAPIWATLADPTLMVTHTLTRRQPPDWSGYRKCVSAHTTISARAYIVYATEVRREARPKAAWSGAQTTWRQEVYDGEKFYDGNSHAPLHDWRAFTTPVPWRLQANQSSEVCGDTPGGAPSLSDPCAAARSPHRLHCTLKRGCAANTGWVGGLPTYWAAR